VFVVVPRHVRASDARFARDSLEKAGYTCRVGPSPLEGYVLAEFAVALQREERVVAAAFEIEVDDLLRGSRAPLGKNAFRRVRFGGSGARIETR
jgi:hypothetical protein